MLEERRNPNPAQVDPALIAACRALPVANIGDDLHRSTGAVGLRPFHDGTPMAGAALTVRTRPGDNKTIHEALEPVRPGDVIVVDGGGDTARRAALRHRRRGPRCGGAGEILLPLFRQGGHPPRPL